MSTQERTIEDWTIYLFFIDIKKLKYRKTVRELDDMLRSNVRQLQMKKRIYKNSLVRGRKIRETSGAPHTTEEPELVLTRMIARAAGSERVFRSPPCLYKCFAFMPTKKLILGLCFL